MACAKGNYTASGRKRCAPKSVRCQKCVWLLRRLCTDHLQLSTNQANHQWHKFSERAIHPSFDLLRTRGLCCWPARYPLYEVLVLLATGPFLCPPSNPPPVNSISKGPGSVSRPSGSSASPAVRLLPPKLSSWRSARPCRGPRRPSRPRLPARAFTPGAPLRQQLDCGPRVEHTRVGWRSPAGGRAVGYRPGIGTGCPRPSARVSWRRGRSHFPSVGVPEHSRGPTPGLGITCP